MKPKLSLLAITLFVLTLSPFVTALESGTDAPVAPASGVSDYAIIGLSDQPLSSYDGSVQGYAATKPVPGHKLDLGSQAAQSYSSYLANERGALKGWLKNNAPEVQVLYEYSLVLNGLAVKLNGHNSNALTHGPNAAWVLPASTYTTQDDISDNLIGAPAVWTALGGQSNAGAGMKIGIIDTGIDQTHPFLTDNSLTLPSGFPKCDARDSAVGTPDTSCLFTSNKILVSKVFQLTQGTNFDAHAAQDHGTHVSGIAAGVANTCAPLVGCAMSGVAPKAYLGNYNVFPGNITDANSIDIAMAVEAAVADGMDVLNLSLGGTPTPHDPLVDAVNDAVDAGVVVAIAAGNAGPGPFSVESPGIASEVITVGASSDPHFIGIPVMVSSLGTFGAALGQFTNFVPASTATYITTSPANGCSSISTNLSGKIALIARGTCTFSTKIRNAQTAGAVGVIVYNSVQGDPTAMAQDGSPNQPTIPAVMVSRPNGLAMAAISPNTVTVDGTTRQHFLSGAASADILASFSSIGPPILVLKHGKASLIEEIKPDVVAPGVNVLSSVPAYDCSTPPCYAFFSGTSMATPHVAGAAAILKQLHPDWSPLQIKSSLETTGDPVKSFNTLSPLSNPMVRGGGRINLANAGSVSATVDADDGIASVDFGTSAAVQFTRPEQVTVTDTSGVGYSYSVSVNQVQSVGPSISAPSSFTVGAGQSAKLTVTLTVSAGTSPGDYYGYVVLSGGPVPLSIPYWVELATPHHAGRGVISL